MSKKKSSNGFNIEGLLGDKPKIGFHSDEMSKLAARSLELMGLDPKIVRSQAAAANLHQFMIDFGIKNDRLAKSAEICEELGLSTHAVNLRLNELKRQKKVYYLPSYRVWVPIIDESKAPPKRRSRSKT